MMFRCYEKLKAGSSRPGLFLRLLSRYTRSVSRFHTQRLVPDGLVSEELVLSVPVAALPTSLVVSRVRLFAFALFAAEPIPPLPDDSELLPAERSFLPESLLSIPAPAEPVSLLVEELVAVPGREEPIALLPDKLS